MKYSIVIDITNIELFISTTIFSLDKFLQKEDIDKIIVILPEYYIKYTTAYSKIHSLNLIYTSNHYYNFINISQLITTDFYIVLTENHILTQLLYYKDIFNENKNSLNCSLESFPHGTLIWSTNRYQWFECFQILNIPINENIYKYKCMTISPQIFITNIAKKIHQQYQITKHITIPFYWFYLQKENFRPNISYDNNNILWNNDLSFNAFHNSSLVPIDYLCRTASNGCKNSSKFITISDVDLSETIFDELSKPFGKSLQSLMNNFLLFTSSFPFIRLGENKDGGYVLCDIPSKILYGYGIGNTYQFEEEFISRYNSEICFLYDHTVSTHITNNKIIHKKIGLDYYQHDFPDPKHILYGTSVDTLENHLRSNNHWGRNDICLKIDIEGYEWLSLLFASNECLKHFNQIIIEFHWINSDRNATITQKIQTLEKLNNLFSLVHIHGVNCRETLVIDNFKIHPVLEATFIRKDINLYPKIISKPILPTYLDKPNDSCLGDIILSNFYPYNTI